MGWWAVCQAAAASVAVCWLGLGCCDKSWQLLLLVLRHRCQALQASGDRLNAQSGESLLACGDAEQLYMAGLRLDCMLGSELEHHEQLCPEVAGMRHPVPDPQEQAGIAVSGSQVVLHLVSDQKDGLIRVHGDLAEVCWPLQCLRTMTGV